MGLEGARCRPGGGGCLDHVRRPAAADVGGVRRDHRRGQGGRFPEGTVRYFLAGRFYVTSYGGSLYALYQKCTHLGCRVPLCDSSEMFECPCHGSVYNIKGEYIAGPAPRGLDRFPVTIEGSDIRVDTGTLIEGPAKGILTGPAEPAGPSCSGEDGEAATEGSP